MWPAMFSRPISASHFFETLYVSVLHELHVNAGLPPNRARANAKSRCLLRMLFEKLVVAQRLI